MIAEIVVAGLVGLYIFCIWKMKKHVIQKNQMRTNAMKELMDNPPKFPPWPEAESLNEFERQCEEIANQETRPWGHFVVLLDDKNCKVKKLVVNSKQRLSLQSHEHRDEHWTVVSGIAYVWIHETKFDLFPGETINIPRLAKHRIENRTDESVEIIEVQTGDSFEETDITRYEDDWGRQSKL